MLFMHGVQGNFFNPYLFRSLILVIILHRLYTTLKMTITASFILLKIGIHSIVTQQGNSQETNAALI